MERFVICRASAGSGKTYTLVRTFIEISIAVASQVKDRFEHVLAITFTNKAANGMKERIMKKLKEIVNNDPDDKNLQKLIEEIRADLNLDDCDEVVSRCKVLQSAIMHNYSKLSVCTIDSFVHRLVKNYAYDLRLPMNFDVIIENEKILQTSVDELMSQAGMQGEESLTRVLCAFAESRMESGGNYNFEREVKDLSKELFTEGSPEFLDALKDMDFDRFLDIEKSLRKQARGFEKSVTDKARQFIDACSNRGIGAGDLFYKNKGPYGFAQQLSQGNMEKAKSVGAYVVKAYDDHVLYNGKNAAMSAAVDEVFPLFDDLYETVVEGQERYNICLLQLAEIYKIALLNKMSQLKNKYYEDNEIVHISEFNKKIAESIANEPAPFIYERIGTWYTNYLIDEFQDTSKLQWLNFLPLLDEAMTHHFPAGTAEAGTRSLVVGDGKQAIYRFRQGDVRQFMRLPDVDSKLHGQSLKDNSLDYPLKCNFRTLSTIVDFNNEFFEHIITTKYSDNESLRGLYIGRRPTEEPELWQEHKKEGGYVQVSFGDNENIYMNIKESIRRQVEEKHYRYSDIMVLARTNRFLSEVSTCLVSDEGGFSIPVVSSESFLLKNSAVVALLQSMLEVLCDTKNRVASAQVAKLAADLGCVEASRDEMLWRLRECGYDLAAAMNAEGIALDVEALRSLSLYDCCEELVRLFGVGGKDAGYVSRFLDEVSKYTQYGRNDIKGFVELLDEKMDKLSCSTTTEADAVKLMTVHKAKGLEEKIVMYAMPSKKLKKSSLWIRLPETHDEGLPVVNVERPKNVESLQKDFDEEEKLVEMDEVNVLYVAMTRPEEKLFVFCGRGSSNVGLENYTSLHDFVVTKQGMTVVMEQKEENEEGETGDAKNSKEKMAVVGETYCIGEDSPKGRAEKPGSEEFQKGGDGKSAGEELQKGREEKLDGEEFQKGGEGKPIVDREEPQKGREEKPGSEGFRKGRTEKPGGDSEDNSAVVVDNVAFPKWGDRLLIAEQSDEYLSKYEQDNRRYGVLVHNLLALISCRDDVDDVVDAFCEKNDIKDSDAASIKSRIVRMMESDGNSLFFDKRYKSLREAPIACNGEVRRPDRIVFADDAVWVVDFKTGSREDESHRRYELQVERYARALREMGYENVRTKILYL